MNHAFLQPSLNRPGLRSCLLGAVAAVLWLGLSGPVAHAALTVTPRVGDVEAGNVQTLEAFQPNGELAAGRWVLVNRNPDGDWVEAGEDQGILQEGGEGGRCLFQAPKVPLLSVSHCRFIPAEASVPPILVPLRVWPVRPALATGSKSARRQSGLMPVKPQGSSEDGTDRPKVRKSAPPVQERRSIPEERGDETALSCHAPAFEQTAAALSPPDLEEGCGLRTTRKRLSRALTEDQEVAFVDDPSKTIGTGSYATVVEVETSDNRVAAAKVFSRLSGKNMALPEQERDIIKLLNHENVIKLLGYRLHHSEPVIIMELADQSLQDILYGESPQHLEEPRIKAYAEQILSGLNHIHQRHVVHGDLKSANILQAGGKIKIADFGSARRCEGTLLEPQDAHPCTPLWGSPEILGAGDGRGYDQKADIWAFGCVLLEMLTNQLPWAEKKFSNVFSAMFYICTKKTAPKLPEDASPALADFLGHCFEQNPEERWDAQALLNHPYLTGS